MSILRWWSERRQAEARARAEREQAVRVRAAATAEVVKEAMLGRHCPLHGGLCFEECVHFRPYHVDVIDMAWRGPENLQAYVHGPGCRLWGG